jgi:hypothetical protein
MNWYYHYPFRFTPMDFGPNALKPGHPPRFTRLSDLCFSFNFYYYYLFYFLHSAELVISFKRIVFVNSLAVLVKKERSLRSLIIIINSCWSMLPNMLYLLKG